MEYYLVRLTYTPAAWTDLVASTTSLDERLEPVRKLLRHLGGSLATFNFFGSEHYRNDAHNHDVRDKFAMFGGHDLLTIVAFPDRKAALAFNQAISAEAGLAVVDLTPMVPLQEAVEAMAVAKAAVAATGYAAPGRGER